MNSVMTTSAILSVKNKKICSPKFVEKTSESSTSDFLPSKVGAQDTKFERNKNDFINTFICHLIFYGIFCVSIVLHVLFDLGVGTFMRKIFTQLIELLRNNGSEKNPSFA